MSTHRPAFLDLPPLQAAHGTVQLPGSKSISNRVLLLAGLCSGATVLSGVLDSDDTRVMLAALQHIGCGVARGEGDTVTITGIGAQLPAGVAQQADAPLELFLGNAGTAMRPLTAALAMLGGHFLLTGVPRMYERPIGDLVDGLQQLDCEVHYAGNNGYPPLRIGPRRLPVGDAARSIRVRGDVSSQFLTALLLAAPLAGHALTIEVEGELISKPYIEITLQLMQRFGVAVQRDATGWQRFTIAAGACYHSPGQWHVEADASSASYFIALGALAADAAQGHSITVQGVGADSIQGDIRFIEAAEQMGARISSTPGSIRIQRGAWPLRAIDLDCNHIPDAAMTLAAMALYADGPSTLRNIASWRVKETDRIAAMATELRKLGAAVEEGADFIRITPPASAQHWRAASIHTYDDHRMAMSLSLAAFNPAR
ncbi:MAG: 3-phosphoshikimate 1-carboxyvinyltransferase, partial [Comamonadaceae bacterium]|nr:3-phosphoshikimate 1-carboxyvinyltransferase [Comamonadaceae bacterium]